MWMHGVLLWGLSCLLWVCVCAHRCTEIFSFGALPWGEHENQDIMRQVRKAKKLARPVVCPDSVYGLMLECWKLDPITRVTAETVEAELAAMWDEHGYEQEMQDSTWPERGQAVQLAQGAVAHETHNYNVDLESSDQQHECQRLEIAPDSIVMQRQLGKGAFGAVHMGVLNGRSVAIKTLHGGDEEAERKFVLEARLLVALRHPNIVAIQGMCTQQQPLMIVLELMGADLKTYLTRIRKGEVDTVFGDADKVDVCLQLCKAIEFLARSNVIHRDIAARFVLFDLACHDTDVGQQKCACRAAGSRPGQAERPWTVAHAVVVAILPQDEQRQGAGEVDGAGGDL
jgi:hypothetical protein